MLVNLDESTAPLLLNDRESA
jgi:hypothetical protein